MLAAAFERAISTHDSNWLQTRLGFSGGESSNSCGHLGHKSYVCGNNMGYALANSLEVVRSRLTAAGNQMLSQHLP